MQGFIEDRPTPWIEQAGIELVSPNHRHERSRHPRGEYRRCKKGQHSTEGDDMSRGTQIENVLQAIPEQVDRMRGVRFERHTQVRATRGDSMFEARGATVE